MRHPLDFRPIGVGAMCAGLAACAGAPEPPKAQSVDAGRVYLATAAAETLQSGGAVDDAWWGRFEDPALTALIERALSQNASLDAARANIRAAQAQLGRTRLARSPSTSSTTDADFRRSASDDSETQFEFGAGLGASWEWDAFGRIEAEVAAAAFDLTSARQARRDVAVIVASETALAYVDLRGAQRRLEVARGNAEAQGESLELLRELFDNGRATRLDIERGEAQYRTTLASLPIFEADIEAALSRLAALTGDAPGVVGEERVALRAAVVDIPEHSGALVAGAPEDLLRRRPDIRQAEAAIGQRLALGEVNRARLFPTITLDASVSAAFDDENDIGDASSFGFGIGPSIRWDGPDLRRVQADINVADAQSEAAFATYRQTVLDALSEVEIALTDYAQERRRRNDLVRAAEAARRALDLAGLRFEEGLDDYLDVLDAQRTLLDAEDQLAQSRLQTARGAIAAYRSLGGVWSDALLDDVETDQISPVGGLEP